MPIAVIEEHYNRAVEFGKHLDATEVWVVHFTVKEQGDDFQYPIAQDRSLNVMYIWHSTDFSSYKVVCSKGSV